MAGYANRTIMLDFPELSEDGDKVHVVIKNPRTLPLAELTPQNVATDENGEPNTAEAMAGMYKVMAGLVKAWHVYDATSDDDDQPALPLPATPESVAKLPHEIMDRILDEINKVMAPKEAQTTPIS